MNIFQRSLAIAAVSILASFGPVAPAAAGVDDALEGQHHITALIDEALHSFNKDMTREAKIVVLRSLIEKYGDIDLSAKDVLGRYWAKASAEQQAQFPPLFLDYAIGSWVDQFGDMPAEERIDFISTEPLDDDRVLYRSMAVAPSGKTPVDWTLKRNAQGRLAIVDVGVEGVSIIKAMGADFTAVIRANAGKIEALFDALQKKIASYTAPPK